MPDLGVVTKVVLCSLHSAASLKLWVLTRCTGTYTSLDRKSEKVRECRLPDG